MFGMLVAIELVAFHTVDGRTVLVNPAQVTQVIHPSGKGNKLVVPSARCVIRLEGSYVSVIETCEEVQQKLEGNKP